MTLTVSDDVNGGEPDQYLLQARRLLQTIPLIGTRFQLQMI